MDDVFQRKTVRHFSREILSTYYTWLVEPNQLALEDLVKEVTCDRKWTVLSFLKDLKHIYGYYIDFNLYWIGGPLWEVVAYERSWRFDCKKETYLCNHG